MKQLPRAHAVYMLHVFVKADKLKDGKMKNVKRHIISTLLFTLLAAQALSAEGASYSALYAKAQDYEKQGRWLYALCTYYDAVQADPGSALEAAERFKLISDAVNSGNPGLGSYTAESRHTGWLALLQDAEKYWTADSPYEYTFSILKHDGSDASVCRITVKSSLSRKYGAVMGSAVAGGLVRARDDSWNDISGRWPDVSVYKSSDDAGSFMQNGAALTYCRGTTCPAWNLVYDRGAVYQLECTVCRADGSVIAASGKTVPMNGTFTLSGLSADEVQQIEGGQATVRLTGLYLRCGVYDDDAGSFAAKSKQYAIPPATAVVFQNESERDKAYAVPDIFRQVEIGRALKKINSYVPVAVAGMEFIRGGVLVSAGSTAQVVDSFYVSSNHAPEYSSAYCNLLNEREGLTDYYTARGESAGVYRLMTDTEKQYLLSIGKQSGQRLVRSADGITAESEKFHNTFPWVTGIEAAASADVADRKPIAVTVSGHMLTASKCTLELSDGIQKIPCTVLNSGSATAAFPLPVVASTERIAVLLNGCQTGYIVTVQITDKKAEQVAAEKKAKEDAEQEKRDEQREKDKERYEDYLPYNQKEGHGFRSSIIGDLFYSTGALKKYGCIIDGNLPLFPLTWLFLGVDFSVGYLTLPSQKVNDLYQVSGGLKLGVNVRLWKADVVAFMAGGGGFITEMGENTEVRTESKISKEQYSDGEFYFQGGLGCDFPLARYCVFTIQYRLTYETSMKSGSGFYDTYIAGIGFGQ